MSEEYFEYGNVSVEQLFDMIEATLVSEEAHGVKIDDIYGRTWYIALLSETDSKIN